MQALLRALMFLMLSLYPLMANALTVGEAYDLELPDGNRIYGAVYRGKDGGSDSFELASVMGRIKIKEYRIRHQQKALPWFVAMSPGYLVPMHQKELGFSHALGANVAGSVPLFSGRNAWVPRLNISGGFSRYSGSKALLYGPELAVGPGWVMPLGSNSRFFAVFTLTAGIAFYELFNQNLRANYPQTTFLGTAELGLGIRFSEWGIIGSYVQNYVHDEKLPLTSGGVKIGAVYFGGKV